MQVYRQMYATSKLYIGGYTNGAIITVNHTVICDTHNHNGMVSSITR